MVRVIIAGRTGTGKTTLLKTLTDYFCVPPLVTYTDRPIRDGEDPESYHFLSEKEMDSLLAKKDTELPVTLGNYRYCTTKGDLEKAELMVLEPSGIYRMLELFPEDDFLILYTAAPKEQILPKIRERDRENPEEAIKKYEARAQKEGPVFTAFENDLKRLHDKDNVTVLHPAAFPKDRYAGFMHTVEIIRTCYHR